VGGAGVAWVRDLGSTNGTAIYGRDGAYVLYTGRADDRAPVLGIPPKSYGFRTHHEVEGQMLGAVYFRLPHAASSKPTMIVRV